MDDIEMKEINHALECAKEWKEFPHILKTDRDPLSDLQSFESDKLMITERLFYDKNKTRVIPFSRDPDVTMQIIFHGAVDKKYNPLIQMAAEYNSKITLEMFVLYYKHLNTTGHFLWKKAPQFEIQDVEKYLTLL